ncbi:MAG: SulP family inorganic anion transporter [Methylococcaceae bacterium]|nr:SulP family inorganic anion transporter [Methylococcaceae bacterium]MCI0667264.1 SulP family inorganic anion transporter [Methylococcaceae bacterium]
MNSNDQFPHHENLKVLANLRTDIPAGLAVFLIAVPLALGIALASGAPLFSGLMAGVIGGLVIPLVSHSPLGVSGPAAGLAVIVLAAIQELGFEAFLLAVVLAGLFQIIMGVLKAGIIGYYFPSSVITGMLSGIGIIIILKQIPHAAGYDADFEGNEDFHGHDGHTTLSELLHTLDHLAPGAIIIALVSLAVLILWEQPFVKRFPIAQIIPGSLIAVMAGILMNQAFATAYPALALSQNHLVDIPVLRNGADLINQLSFPDFSALTNPAVYLTALTIAVVASLETLLCVEATDKLDPFKRVTPTNRELVAQGIANACAGLIGALPVTQVIVRSSANIQAGAKTRASAFVHGFLMLIAILVIPGILNRIPLASLAAILIVVGYKLAKPALFREMYDTGPYHFIPFIATVGGLIFSDLLTGVGIGVAIALFYILLENYKVAFCFHEEHENNKVILHLSESVSFLNKAHILQTLDSLPDDSEVVIDASASRYIDYDVYTILKDFEIEAKTKGIRLKLINLRGYGSLEGKLNTMN